MYKKRKTYLKLQRLLLCFFLGFSLCLSSIVINTNTVFANNVVAKHLTSKNNTNPEDLNEKAKQAYRLADYQTAIKLWHQALTIYENNTTKKSEIISRIALANYKLGNKKTAQIQINKSREILEKNNTNQDINSTLGMILNNQGIIELALGNSDRAIESWDLAIATYKTAGDSLGIIRARFNQAEAFKNINLYQRSLKLFDLLYKELDNYPDSSTKLMVLRSYGDLLRTVGEFKKSQSVLEESLDIANHLSLEKEKIKTLLSLGKTLSKREDATDDSVYKSLEYYQQGIDLCSSSSCFNSTLLLGLNLGKFNLLVKTDWNKATNLIETIQKQFVKLKPDRNSLDLKLNFISTLIQLRHQKEKLDKKSYTIPDWQQILVLTDRTITDARNIGYSKAQAYSWLLRGHIQEILSQWNEAQISTTKALTIAQTIDTVEVSYLCQWQLGRIERAKGNRKKAIAHYERGAMILDSLDSEIAHTNNGNKNYFHNTIEPIYREKIALLLDTSSEHTISQENLIKARNTIESLQIAELNNFFREACLKEKSVSIDSVDKDAAAIYPIILPDRLEIIVSIRHRPLQHYSVAVSQTELEDTIARLRQTVVVRSRRSFYQPAQKLYSWLIAPVTQQLAQYNIKTIVLIPDGALRNVPLSVLYDGNNYLIEKYNIVLNPGLQLLNPRPLKDTSLKTLAVGLTQKKGEFAALDYVSQELAEIQNQVKSSILIDEEFTSKTLQEKITYTDYPIVHIATHGQFSSSLNNTFLLAWNGLININELEQILQIRAIEREKAIELLVLSACETATGDENAALGLAGMAIRAGAKSTIATLWSVNDRATAELMKVLYQKLTDESIGKAEAIRQAQLSLLQNSQYEHPFYWGAYTIIGNWL